MTIQVGQTYRVVNSFSQSGSFIPNDSQFRIMYGGQGQQVGCEFYEQYFRGMHTCGGVTAHERGFWIYRWKINANCVMDTSEPSWEL